MSNQYLWAQPLGIEPSEIALWESEKDSSADLLVWALQQQKVDHRKYLEWAHSFYQLPILQTSFFAEQQDTTYWESSKDKFVWNENLFPVHEWDGTLFIGCVEPPRNVDLDQPVQFVLCHLQELNARWHLLNPPEEVEMVEDATAIIAVPPPLPEEKQTPPPVPELTPVPEPEAQPATPPPTPEGINLDLSAFTPSGDADFQPPVEHEDNDGQEMAEETEEPEEIVMPEGMSAAPTMTSFDFSNPNDTPAPTSEPVAPPPLEQPPLEQPPTPPAMETSPPELDLAISVPPPAPNGPPAPPSAAPAPPPMPNAESSFNTSPGSENVIDLTPGQTMELTQVQSMDDLATFIFLKMDRHFDRKMMIANYRNQGFEPVRWTSEWTPSADGSNPPVEVDQPGIFNIAFKTKKPFHGRVAQNAFNDKFFSQWTKSEYPQSITVCPVVNDNRVIGFIVGTSRNIEPDFKPLNETQELAQLVVPAFNQLGSMAAKAA
jgi:hypothetical protein